MHAVGTRARLPAARCLGSQSNAKAHLQLQPFSPRHSVARTSGIVTTPLIARFDTRQTRLLSSKPDGAPDKPEGNEKEDGKEKDDHPTQPPASSETTGNSASETKKQPALFALGRGRTSNVGGPNTGLPPVTFAPWFLDEHVQLFDPLKSSIGKAFERIQSYIQPTKSRLRAEKDNGDSSAVSEQAPGDEADIPSRVICRELLSTISAELDATPPHMRATKDPKKRPVSMLYVLNYKGSRIANDVVNHVAEGLRADVVHLDAVKLARILGPYLGSTLYFGRGNIAMLGYAAAEASGRSTSAGPLADGEDGFDVVRGGMNVMKFFQPADDRATWDDLKMTHAIKEIANAPTIKRGGTKDAEATKPSRVILHIHNYVELHMSSEGTSIINKIRTVVDRLWQDGTKIVIVGSSSNDSTASPKWHARVKELSIQDCYPIIFSPKVDELHELKTWEQDDYLRDNLAHLNWMLACLKFEQARVEIRAESFKSEESNQALKVLRERLSAHILSIHWIFRLATQAIGLERYNSSPLDVFTLADALWQMDKADDARSEILRSQISSRPEAGSVSTAPPNSLESLLSLGDIIKPATGFNNSKPNPSTMDLDEEEKKLLSGLVNANNIHTSFDEVIAPPEVRESLISLTTLSLQHPKAFSYGVLSRERIHGCLLYGPPGTGKTLMAKALAKGSGANMLEISAASINDMWVGNSEKNVRAVFSLARKMSPMVVFLDEADALLGSRGRQTVRGGQRETINQFLREWDGLTNALSTQQIFVMVSTNRPQDLDEAVLRRLPRRILVDLPLKEGRLAILKTLLRDEVLDNSVSLEHIARKETELYSGSDLKNLAVAAAMEAAKEELAAAKENGNIGPAGTYKFPVQRVLCKQHFDKALRDISASISEDMQSLKAIRKFDEQYGDARRKKKKTHMGFEVVPQVVSSEEARVRK